MSPKHLRSALVAALAALSAPVHAADLAAPGIWTAVQESRIAKSASPKAITPTLYRTYTLDRALLGAFLARAPLEASQAAADSDSILQLPRADGSIAEFRIVESPIMEAELAARHPEIRTYLGQGITDPTQTLRFDVTPKGFHAQVIGSGGSEYIDPLQPDDVDHYMVYAKRDLPKKDHTCSVTGETIDDHPVGRAVTPAVSTGASLRTYRLALATTGEFTQFHGGTVADGLAAVVTTMNRVDGIYEREVAVRMVLVANEEAIIYTNPLTDPYTNTNANSLLTQNKSNLSTVIGNANFDIGHVAGTGGGGLAGLGVVCGANKAQGETGSSAPVGDAYDVDYVAHEMGHQFGGNHTFNGTGVNCGGNGSTAANYEVGSGVTIQAYAGICGADDLQPNSEDHFHRASLNEIIAYTTTGTGGTCGSTAATGNAVPSVAGPGNFTIPKSTPFSLTASATDADAGDTLTYLWEEFDHSSSGFAATPGVLTDDGSGPLFRDYAPTTSPTRSFPSLRFILNNANVPPQTGPLQGTTSPNWFTGELLPSTARTMNFRVTVRDNHAGGGGTNEANAAVTIDPSSGPFAVTAPNTAVTWAAGSTQTVSWNVANTSAAPVSTANVAIRLSTDGGATFPTTLLASTPNTGSASVTLPGNLATTQARIRIEAVGNIYFDLSDADFTISNAGNLAPTISTPAAVAISQGGPAATVAVATVSDDHDSAGSLQVAVANVPAEMLVNVANVGGTVNFTVSASCTLVAPTSGTKTYPVELRVTDLAGAVRTAAVNITVSGNKTPTLGSYANANIPVSTTRTYSPSAAPADANGNLTGVSVSPTTLPGGGTVAIAADGTVTVTTTASTTLGTTTVQANAIDSCGAQESRRFNVTVGNPNITLAAAGNTVLSGNAIVEPNECNQVNLMLRNDGNLTATGVSAVLSTSNPNVTITQASSGFPDIVPGATQTSSTPFTLSTASGATCFSNLDLTLTVSYGGGAGSPAGVAYSVPVGKVAATNYSVTTSSGATIPAGGVLVAGSQVDDGLVSITVPTGFSFIAYGTTIAGGTTLRASSNGNLQQRASQGATDAGNTALPTPGAGSGSATFPAAAPTWFLLWDDWQLDPTTGNVPAGAGIYTQLVGTAPNRQWIIEWRGRRKGDGATTTINDRSAIVFFEGSSQFDYIYETSGVNGNANGTGATVGIQAASTGTTFTQYAVDTPNLTPGTRLSFALAPAVCNAGSGGCAAAPGVTVVQSGGNTSVTEGGASDSYTMVLNTQPTADVTVSISQGSQVTTSPTQLVFTTVNWATPQTVTVTAVDDTLVEGAHTGTITHTAAGGNYAGISIANVVANVTDNDAGSVVVTQSGGSTNVTEGGATDSYTLVLGAQPAGTVTITISPDSQVTTSPATSVTFTNADWNVPKTVTVTAVDDALVEGPHTGTITHAASGSGYSGVAIAAVVANITDNDANTVDLAISNQLIQPPSVAGAAVSYEVLIDNLSAGVNAPTATFVFTAPPELVNLAWTCVADAGASCPASGSGAPNHSVSMNGATGLAYSITGNVGAAVPAGTAINTTATITVGGALTDSNPANNSAQANATVATDAVFKDGFE